MKGKLGDCPLTSLQLLKDKESRHSIAIDYIYMITEKRWQNYSWREDLSIKDSTLVWEESIYCKLLL